MPVMWNKNNAAAHYAGFHRRMWAAMIDTLLLVLLTPLFNLISVGGNHISLDADAVQRQMEAQTDAAAVLGVLWRAMVDAGIVHYWLINTAMQTALLCLLTAFCWHKWSATPGKMLLGIKVVDAVTEAPISNRQIFLRLIGYFVSSFPALLGFFWIAFDKRKQGWHDKIAGTVVVMKPRSTPGSATVRP